MFFPLGGVFLAHVRRTEPIPLNNFLSYVVPFGAVKLFRQPNRSAPRNCAIEVHSLRDEEFTPPPQAQQIPEEASLTPPDVGRAKKTKKPRQINSFTSSTSRFDDGLGRIQDVFGTLEPLEILEPQPGQMPWDCPSGHFAYMSRCLPRRGCGSLCLGFWSPTAKGWVWPSSNRFISIVPFPEDYTTYKDQLRRRNELSWSKISGWWSPKSGSVILRKRTSIQWTSRHFPSFLSTRKMLLRVETVRTTLNTTLEGATTSASPCLPRARESSGGGSKNPRVKRVLVEGSTVEERSRTEVFGQVAAQNCIVPEETEFGDHLAYRAATGGGEVAVTGFDTTRVEGFEGESNAVDAAEVSVSDAIGKSFSSSSLPFFKGGEFAFKLSKDNTYGFEFCYEGEGPFLNNQEGCDGFQHLLVESHDKARPPAPLMREAEIFSLARLEQRVSLVFFDSPVCFLIFDRLKLFGFFPQVAYRRTKLAYDCERLLALACSKELSTKGRLRVAEEAKVLAEKERDEARDEVEELKKALRLAKREKR
ncbi:unnamed protein product [Cochlearia groenlandica]